MARDDAFSVEVDPAGGGLTIEYGDVVAHEAADLVAESADAVAALPGVTGVVHEDRERLLVRTDGRSSVTATDVEAALTAFWRGQVPTLTWELAETSSGFEPAVVGLPAGPVHVVKRSLDLLSAALRPLTAGQDRLYRRYNPIRAAVDRWLEGAPRATSGRRRMLGRFRRG